MFGKLVVAFFITYLYFPALPRPPTNVRVSEVTPTSVRLSWSYPGASGSSSGSASGSSTGEVQYYVIQYKPRLASWDYKEISGAITTFYDIRGLTPYTEYEFAVLVSADSHIKKAFL